MSRGGLRRGLVAVALASLSGVAGAEESVRTLPGGGVELVDLDLDGALVSALAARPDELLLLVRPAAEVDGPRRLLRLELGGEASVSRVASGVGGWTKTLVALDLGVGPRLLVGGLGRVDEWGDLATPAAAPRPLLQHPGLDLRSVDPARFRDGIERALVAAEAGWLRVWRPDGAAGLRLDLERRLPLLVEREATGLRLTSPRVTFLPGAGDEANALGSAWTGPETRGGRRLLVTALEAEGEAGQAWVALPQVEEVQESWIVSFDGEPALVVRTQGAVAVDVFEDQRYRVFPLVADRTRAGRAPRLAVEVDTKRWHDTSVAVADTDGDGDDDMILIRPEGMTGGDLVVEVFSGRGGVRFEHGSRRTDLDDGPGEWRLVADPADPGRVALATIGRGKVEIWRFASRGRRALERRPVLSTPLPKERPVARRVEVTVGGGESGVETREVEEHGLLGAVTTSRGVFLLVLERDESGAERLLALRAAGAR